MKMVESIREQIATATALVRRIAVVIFLAVGAGWNAWTAEPRQDSWDTFADTWVATDALGRSLPTHREVGSPRSDKFVGVFYFLWHGQHGQQGPFDITRILATDPQALTKSSSPPWGPKYAMHHWGESIFGYYLSDDEAVIRKHAQMLADAGVDVVIFDVTNGPTYPQSYNALFRAFAEVRRNGGRTPQIAFLCPFGSPSAAGARGKVVERLWKDIYQPGLHPELWFRWDGKPLLLTNPAGLRGDREDAEKHTVPAKLEAGHTLGQSFRVTKPFLVVEGCFPTYGTTNASVTLTLRRDGPQGPAVAKRRFENFLDNAWLEFAFDPPMPAGTYYLEASEPQGKVGWWNNGADVYTNSEAYADGTPVPGDRTFRVTMPNEKLSVIRNFFTFRNPEPSYFRGPTAPDQWSWLEVFPQHVFKNSRGEKEMMSVGVAQNAVGHRLGCMSEPGAMGRSFHAGSFDRTPGAVERGLNFAEQWERALQEDPKFLFITGWNEWMASRFAEFCGIRQPVMFPDEFDQEHSRDIEPMKGGHGDNYFYQMIANIRRFKGVRPLPEVCNRPIQIDGRFDDWRDVTPEFRDDIGDPVRRDHPGWGKAGRYVNQSGRNDIVAAKVSCDTSNVYFYVRTREPLTSCTDPNWMLLFIDADQNPTNGWLGYDFVVNRTGVGSSCTTLEKQQGKGYQWGASLTIQSRTAGNELELAIPRAALGLTHLPATLDFKWADNIPQTGEWSDFTLYGDAAPNDRFNYRARLTEKRSSGSRTEGAP